MSNDKKVISGGRKDRLVSLDALRGFDMFWIIGAGSLATGLVNLKILWSSAIARQLSHSKWNGFTFYDLIFPLFVFITGVSLVLSLQKRMERNDDYSAIVRHVLKRTIVLFLVGIIYYDQISYPFHLERIRVMGVLQRIALCYFFSSLLVIYTKARTQAVTVVGILIGYWAIMRFVPVPGYGAGIWTMEHNLPRYIDNLLLPGRLFHGSWDPEGILTTLPAIATCLLGVLTGHWLRVTEWYRRTLEPRKRALYLFLAGFVLVILGLLVNPFFPINKNLWTSSFVLLTGGLSAMLMSAAYWLIDIRGHRIHAFPFMVIGMNSIFIYFAVRFIPFDKIAAWIIKVSRVIFLGRGQTLIIAMLELSIEGLLLFWLYRRKIFIRI
jgi:predicted acyltransferase